MHAIIGSGIAGIATSLRVRNPVVYDKARFPGGRISSKPLGEFYFCDIGATFFSSEPVEILSEGKVTTFCFQDWLQSYGLNSLSAKLETQNHLRYLPGGMQRIANTLLMGKKSFYSHELVSFTKLPNGEFLLRFLDGSQIESRKLTITAPIPQALNFFPDGEDRSLWEEFLNPYNHYRKTLVACGFYKNPNKKSMDSLKCLTQYSFLNKGEAPEYISIESFKTSEDSSSLVFMIQYSADFSDRNFDNWRKPDRGPSEFCKSRFIQDFQEFLTKRNIPWLTSHEPQEWRIHKWKYAQAESSLLGKSGILNLDSEEFRDYERLVMNTNIQLTGDWLYGPRLNRVAGGILHGRNFYE